MLVEILVLTSVIVLSIYLGFNYGKRAKQLDIYWKGRGEGWRACEDSIIERAKHSNKIDLTEEEVLEELLQ